MGKRKASLHKRRGPRLNSSHESPSTIDPEHEPFLKFDENSELTFYHQSEIYNSLITLVKAKYPFDDALLDRAARFLKSLEPKWGDDGYADKLVTRLVNSLARSSAGFVDSIMTLLSTPHSTMIPAALSFLRQTTTRTSSALLTDLVETGLFDNVLATVQPHTLPISGNEGIFDNLMKIIVECLTLSRPSRLTGLGKIAVVDQLNHREMIFQKVVLPSSQFLTFLISNRHVLNEDLLSSFVELLCKLPEIGPYYRPTLEYVLASPTVMALSNCLLSIENKDHLWYSLYYIHSWLEEWPKEDRKVDKSGKRVMEALFSEGLEDTLEEMMMNDKGGILGRSVDDKSHFISRSLGANVKKPR